MLAALSACGLMRAAEDILDTTAEAEPQLAERVFYEAQITGVDDEGLLELLNASANLHLLRDRPPASLLGLRRRAEEDMERLRGVLRSEGYYDPAIDFRIDAEATPVRVEVAVELGPPYHLAGYQIDYVGDHTPEEAARPSLAQIQLHIGMRAVARDIVEARQRLERLLRERGYPYARVTDQKAFVEHHERRMNVRAAVESGPAARFGAVRIEGLDNVHQGYVRRLIMWSEGDVYNERKVEETRQALGRTGLFTSLVIEGAPSLDAAGALPMTIGVSEGPHRSIGAGAGYSTDIGLGGRIFWEHRNLFSENETLRLTLAVAEIQQSAEADFRKPAFVTPNQALLTNVKLSNENTDAYDQRSVESFVGLERLFSPRWRGTGGVSASYLITDDEQGRRRFVLFGLPMTATRRATDSLLDPTRGTRLDFAVTPYTGAGAEQLLFLRSSVAGAIYHSIDRRKRYILAGRARVGSIVGEQTEAIPADRRFYAGGGGSIRGYKYQSVGPLDARQDPLGGRSLLELGGELRIRVTDNIGVVPFVDGGTVFDAPYPTFDETIRWAAGLGLRYFTDFGPLRLDIAFPINRRDDVDGRFEFYVSFGQAF